MRKKEVKLPLTPLTESTFRRQGWLKHKFSTNPLSPLSQFDDDEDEEPDIIGLTTSNDDESEAYFFILPIPKYRSDKYSPLLVSNATNETQFLKELGISPGCFFVEIMNMDGLGFCDNEEDLEILYRALTGEDINIVKQVTE